LVPNSGPGPDGPKADSAGRLCRYGLWSTWWTVINFDTLTPLLITVHQLWQYSLHVWYFLDAIAPSSGYSWITATWTQKRPTIWIWLQLLRTFGHFKVRTPTAIVYEGPEFHIGQLPSFQSKGLCTGKIFSWVTENSEDLVFKNTSFRGLIGSIKRMCWNFLKTWIETRQHNFLDINISFPFLAAKTVI